MNNKSDVLGIDIGSVCVSIAQLNDKCELVKSAYDFYQGDVDSKLRQMLVDFDLSTIGGVAATTSTPMQVRSDRRYDNTVAVITAAKALTSNSVDNVDSIIIVGGERFARIRLNEFGKYLSYKGNSSCAAGTGGFLDQQAVRLNLDNSAKLSAKAFENSAPIPKIATRCAVFAKTDLIHAQQEGYSVEQICDGLCLGLAKNIIDTLYDGNAANDAKAVSKKVIVCGGVAQNAAVVDHIGNLLNTQVIANPNAHLFGAIGAATMFVEQQDVGQSIDYGCPSDFINSGQEHIKKMHYDALELKLSQYPEFSSLEHYNYRAKFSDVEVDVYEHLQVPGPTQAYLGIDIGSTSTKATLVSPQKQVLAGFYTRTAGQPINAVKGLFQAIQDVASKRGSNWEILGCGTTGSGRKFIGSIVGADLILNEISAHAQAAQAINPEVDTIIEIGGQDAKFTVLTDGVVTSSTMNTVCAAGTGSFIEEQAQKLGQPINEYAQFTYKSPAPMSSDRCTVFMERDLNHYMTEGYSNQETLASVLHAVCENYLIKVANESQIGKTILFQGATAKNKALIAAFEQRLQKPIIVSKFCHLTGALGVCLTMIEEAVSTTKFAGLALHQQQIPLRAEVCDLCNNHCKLTVAEVGMKEVAYGFLCGRDYETKKFVNWNQSGFDLLRARKKAFAQKTSAMRGRTRAEEVVIGLPAALHLYADLPMWQYFFKRLNIPTITSEKYKAAVKEGKTLTGAEFCTPIAAMHGHAKYLLERADYVFLPSYINDRQKGDKIGKQYCYYTQFVTALVEQLAGDQRKRVLTPVIKYLYTQFHSKHELYRTLKKITKKAPSFIEVSIAYDEALSYMEQCRDLLKNIVEHEVPKDDIQVVLLGRPYTVLDPNSNKGIPEIFANLGIKTLYQDMIPQNVDQLNAISSLLDEVHWSFASKVLAAAQLVANMPGRYPVFITSFKCTPDSFILTYFKDLMAAHGKPFLVLELDEHDSSVGYETRIEAAIRSFYNDRRRKVRTILPVKPYAKINPKHITEIGSKTLFVPCWDPVTCRLIVANLKREGINAILMKETESIIRRSLRHNSGQCTPLNAITQGFVEAVVEHNVDPSNALLWVNQSDVCSLKLYPHHIQNLLSAYGEKYEQAGVYLGDLTFNDISLLVTINAYFVYMFGGYLRQMCCKIRPYEVHKGQTDRVCEEALVLFEEVFAGTRSKEETLKHVVDQFLQIEVKKVKRPKVAIFGDIYVRDNDVMNQDLVRYIEKCGGEAVITSYNELCKMVAPTYFRKWFAEGRFKEIFTFAPILTMMKRLEKSYLRQFERILGPIANKYNESSSEILNSYGIKLENAGESQENIIKVCYLQKHYPDLALMVQTNPGFCCASIVTESMAREIESKTGISVLSVTYDGTGGDKNEAVIPYLQFATPEHLDDVTLPPPEIAASLLQKYNATAYENRSVLR